MLESGNQRLPQPDMHKHRQNLRGCPESYESSQNAFARNRAVADLPTKFYSMGEMNPL